jgi:hypothetical protein
MKLELKHICNYLETDNFMYLGIGNKKGYFKPSLFDDGWNLLFDVKPILRPPSDLTKDDDFNFDLNLELCDILNTSCCDNFIKSLINKTYYAVDFRILPELEDFLNRNHFDWKFGLIESGLAVDTNDLNK